MNSDRAKHLEVPAKATLVLTEEDFNTFLKQPTSITYLLVDWSGLERISRQLVFKSLNEINSWDIPIFVIDCSEGQTYLESWLKNQSKILRNFPYHGNGETIFIRNGKVEDYINGSHLGYDGTFKKITSWINNR